MRPAVERVPPTLADAIDDLYRVFSIYPQPRYTDPCLCCHTPEQDRLLRSKPLRLLGMPELGTYMDDALLVWGDEVVFKHFLPRICELLSLPGPGNIRTPQEIVFGKFRHADWRSWPQAEQRAIERFLHALWAAVLNSAPETRSYHDVESWLCALAQAEDDLSPYLTQWERDETTEACLALSSLLLCSAIALPTDRGRNGLWKELDSQYQQLKAWVHSDGVRQKLEAAIARAETETVRSEFEAALSIRA